MYTGRCYCGASRIVAAGAPVVAAYCHCEDCRRWTGAAVPAFVAFEAAAVTLPAEAATLTARPGVERWFCSRCGSPLAARFDYLPDQIYIPVGVLDTPEAFAPALHCHADARIPWVDLADRLPRHAASGRAALTGAG
ncbi:MAG: GFA family protein [Pseudomonadota bacterium]